MNSRSLVLASIAHSPNPFGEGPPTGFGRALYYRRPSRALGALFAVDGLGGLGYGVGALLGKWPKPLWGAGAVLLGALVLALGVTSFVVRYELFEWGLVKRGPFATRSLAFADVAAFTFLTEDFSTGGSNLGGSVRFTLTPAEGKALTGAWMGEVDRDPAVDFVRERATAAVTDRMRARLEADEEVEWVGARLGRERLRVRSRRATEDGWRSFDLGGPLAWRLEDGVLVLELGQEGERFTLPADEENFLPGLAMFTELVRYARARTPVGGGAS